MKLKSSFLFFTILSTLTFCELMPSVKMRRKLDDSTATTTSSTIPTTTSSDPIPSDFACNQELMLSYGFSGNTKPSSFPHKYCPGVKSNCCTDQDANTSMYLWSTDSRERVEKYYEVFLYLVKYIMGYSAEAALLAKDFSSSSSSKCQTAANDFLGMNLNPKLTSLIYGSFADSVVALGNIRKGFYCILCDAQTQKSLKDFWSVTNLFYNDRIYFSNNFCVTLVDKTIQTSYFLVNYIKKFTEDVGTLINCKLGSKNTLNYDIPFGRVTQIKNCFFFKTKYFFFFCENYCERFHLVRPSQLLDNEITELQKFFVLIRDNRDKVFYNPRNNILINGFYEETFITDNIDSVTKTTVFFPAASSHTIDLSDFTTDVVYNGGMDVWPSVDSSTYPMVIANTIRTSINLVLMLVTLYLCK